jgi:hypothetical protein
MNQHEPIRHEPIPVTEGELRSLTADLEDAHHDAMPAMHRTARDAFAPLFYDVSDGAARLASTPTSRRGFLLGAGSLLGGVVLATQGAKLAGASTGRARPRTVARQQKLTGDLAVVALAAALENLAVATYGAGISAATAGKLGAVPPAVVTFATTAQKQHMDHAAAWNGVLTGAGKEAVNGVDLTVKKDVDQQFAQVKDVGGLAKLALSLEEAAAATYLAAIDVVKSPAGIQTAATIEPVELQHAAILNFLLGQYPVPNSFTPQTGARPVSDMIGTP